MSRSRSLSLVAVLAAGAGLASGCLLDGTAFEAAGAAGGTGNGGAGNGNGGSGGSAAGGAVNSGGGGTTASHGTTTSTGTGTTSTSGTTSTGAVACVKDGDCDDPEPGSVCVAAKCANGVCTGQPAMEGEACTDGPIGPCYGVARCVQGDCVADPLPDQHELDDADDDDCLKPVCNGEGDEALVPDDGDAPSSTFCATKSCSDGQVVVIPKNEGVECFVLSKCCTGKCCDELVCALCGE